MKLLTLDDYKKAGEEFWPKYWYVAKELGEDAKAELWVHLRRVWRGARIRPQQQLYLDHRVIQLLVPNSSHSFSAFDEGERRAISEFNKKGFEIYNLKNIDLFNDFESTISILKNLDLFVTVSNSTAHIAGALGIPTIVICPKKSSTYYYWDYDEGLTPWYKNVKILKGKGSIKNTIIKLNELIENTI